MFVNDAGLPATAPEAEPDLRAGAQVGHVTSARLTNN